MAPKRSKPIEDPPAASSSEEEEEETSSGEEEEEDGDDEGEEEEGSTEEETEEQPKKASSPPPPQQTQTAKPAPKKPNSTTQQAESESESGSEEDSDDEDEQADNDATVKPIASKPMEETPVKTPTKSRSKPSASTQAATKSTAAAKRLSETDRDVKDTKRAKKKDSEADGVVEKSEDTKKQLFQRKWSEDDEIAVLKGIIDFTEKKGFDPSKDMNGFLDFIKKSLHFDVSLTQLKDKVWRLKKKFENHVSKGKKGEDKTFSKAHDQTSFDLSKKIWGSEATSGVESSARSNGKARKGGSSSSNNQRGKSLAALKAELGMDTDKETEKVDKMEVETESHSGLKQITKFDKGVSVAGMEEYVVKTGLDMLEGAKKAEMEEKWRKLHVAELELFLKRNELIREQAKLMLAAYKTE